MFELIDLIFAFALGSIFSVIVISWIAHRWLNHLRELLEEAMNEVADPKEIPDPLNNPAVSIFRGVTVPVPVALISLNAGVEVFP